MKLDWDHYSDQPHVIKDKVLKKQIYKQVRWHNFKMLITNLLMYPLCYVNYHIGTKKDVIADTHTFFGLSANFDKNPEQAELIEDLGVDNLLIRMPLVDIENIHNYVDFATQFKGKSLLITRNSI